MDNLEILKKYEEQLQSGTLPWATGLYLLGLVLYSWDHGELKMSCAFLYTN
jgi:hypothetical protein